MRPDELRVRGGGGAGASCVRTLLGPPHLRTRPCRGYKKSPFGLDMNETGVQFWGGHQRDGRVRFWGGLDPGLVLPCSGLFELTK